MSQTTILKLGSLTTDTVSGAKGMLTHLQISLDSSRLYHFQPRGLNPEDHQPVEGVWLVENRLSGAAEDEVDLPLDVLGTQVTDRASGFKGTAITLVLHINGCVHLDVKPKGTLKRTGATIAAANFDIRRLEGPALKAMTEVELKRSCAATPSPSPVRSPHRG